MNDLHDRVKALEEESRLVYIKMPILIGLSVIIAGIILQLIHG